jgi:hypothetical protein
LLTFWRRNSQGNEIDSTFHVDLFLMRCFFFSFLLLLLFYRRRLPFFLLSSFLRCSCTRYHSKKERGNDTSQQSYSKLQE